MLILIGYLQFENERGHDYLLVTPVFLCDSSLTPRRESPKVFLDGCQTEICVEFCHEPTIPEPKLLGDRAAR
jgi:hypothetical protein